MRLISFRTSDGHDALGVVAGSSWIPAAALLPAGPATMEALLRGPSDALDELRRAADPDRIQREGRPLDEATLLAPVSRPGKVVAIGRNYQDHAAESGSEPPPSPLIFSKWPSSVIGPGDEIRWDPALATQVDFEAELGVVIGRTARRVSEADALSYVLGYTCVDDVSARDLQFGDGQWVRGKSLDTFCPIGPVVVTLDEIGDPDDLAISCVVNGETVQEDRTSNMFYGVRRLISHCSNAFTLEPGDVIATGTPGGVGDSRKPPRYLREGDTVEIWVEHVGSLVNPVVNER